MPPPSCSDGELVTVDAGSGIVTEGKTVTAEPIEAAEEREAAAPSQPLRTKLLVNLSEPSQLERVEGLDVDGVGLLRAELMVVEALDGEHPRALLERGEGERFVERMADSLMQFAAAFSPRPITYRTIDFRSNEFRGLKGGERFEPEEANPMIGYRGALRYTHEPDLFELELQGRRPRLGRRPRQRPPDAALREDAAAKWPSAASRSSESACSADPASSCG